MKYLNKEKSSKTYQCHNVRDDIYNHQGMMAVEERRIFKKKKNIKKGGTITTENIRFCFKKINSSLVASD